MRVLVVDDDRAVREALRRALMLTGYEVRLAEDGAQAIEQVVQAIPDAVVLDIGMPGMNGLEVCRRLRLLGNRVPILMLTAREAVSDRVAGLDAGADDYLVKPFSARELKARVRAHLELARQRRGLERELEQRVQARTAEVARLTGVLQMLSGINTALVRIQNRDEVMAEACRLAHGIGGYVLAMVALIDPTTRMAR